MDTTPETLDQITAAWFTTALRNDGHLVPDVAELSLESIGGILGATGQVGRLRVKWAGETEYPSTFVAKAPNTDEISKLMDDIMCFYSRESGFYREVADRIEFPKARGYVNVYDAAADRHLLVIEDMAPGVDGDILLGTDLDTARELIEMLGRLHGRFWMDQSIAADWLHVWDREGFWSNVWVGQGGWTEFKEEEPGFFPDDLSDLIEKKFLYDCRAWCEAIDERPWTFTHGDYQLDNFIFRDDGPVLIDWQLCMRTVPSHDVSWFFATSCRQLIEHERELMDAYRASLAAHGGPSWSHDQLMEDLAWGLMYWVAGQPVTATMDQSHHGDQAERMERRFRSFLEGTRDCAVRWDMATILG